MSRSPLTPYFRALPPYLGGKQKLVPWIFNRLSQVIPQGQWTQLRFLDAFVGGGSISMAAKVLGFQSVHSNDWSARSRLVIKGLLANQSQVLTTPDQLKLVNTQSQQASPGWIEGQFCPAVFSKRHARALDRYLSNAGQLQCPTKRALALLVAWRLITDFVCMPTSIGTSNRPYAETLDGLRDWQTLNPKRFVDGSMSRLLKPSWSSIERHMQVTNQGVFSGTPVIGYHQDAFQFVQVQSGDVLYLDPPYPATSNYETANRTLDAVLFNSDPAQQPSVSPFSKGTPALEALLDLAQQSTCWVLSYGNRVVTLDELTTLVKRVAPHRTVYSEARKYTHMAHVSKNTQNQELLVIAYQ